MRTGVTVSAIAHIAVIVIAIIGLSSAQQLQPDEEQSIAVDLVPVQDAASITAGNEQSKVVDTKTPSAVKSDKPVTPNRPTGNTDQIQPKPAAADTPTPMPTTSSAPAPQPQPTPVVPQPLPQPAPQPAPQPLPEPAPQPLPQPQPQPAPQPQPTPQPAPQPQPRPEPKASSAPTPLSQLAADSSTADDSAADTPTPAAQAASLAQKRAELKKQQDQKAAADQAKAEQAKAAQAAIAKTIAEADAKAEADAAKAAAAQAQADAKAEAATAAKAAAAAKKAAAAKQLASAQQAAKAAKAADEISSLINDQKSTGATTGSGGTPSAGKATGKAARLTNSEIGVLVGQIKKCWTLLPNEIEAGLSVELLFSLDTNGGVTGTPKVVKADQSEMGGSIARAAQRAIAQCGPYSLPAGKYDEWKQVDVTMFTSDQ